MITQKRLKELLSYNYETGVFTWKVSRGKANKGMDANSVNGLGYIQIGIDGKRYLGHRLAWLYMNSEMPEKQIDHINHNKRDNRIVNLRNADYTINSRNVPIQKNNKTGIVGVAYCKINKSYQVTIYDKGVKVYNRRHKLFIDAVKIRKSLEVKYGYHKNHGEKLCLQ